MGLDQHAHLRNQKIDWEDYYMNDNSKDQKVFVWRKHARLQQFMAKKWEEQNPSIELDGHLSHLGFNGDQDAPCYMTCLLYTSPSPRDRQKSRMPSSA